MLQTGSSSLPTSVFVFSGIDEKLATENTSEPDLPFGQYLNLTFGRCWNLEVAWRRESRMDVSWPWVLQKMAYRFQIQFAYGSRLFDPGSRTSQWRAAEYLCPYSNLPTGVVCEVVWAHLVCALTPPAPNMGILVTGQPGTGMFSTTFTMIHKILIMFSRHYSYTTFLFAFCKRSKLYSSLRMVSSCYFSTMIWFLGPRLIEIWYSPLQSHRLL